MLEEPCSLAVSGDGRPTLLQLPDMYIIHANTTIAKAFTVLSRHCNSSISIAGQCFTASLRRFSFAAQTRPFRRGRRAPMKSNRLFALSGDLIEMHLLASLVLQIDGFRSDDEKGLRNPSFRIVKPFDPPEGMFAYSSAYSPYTSWQQHFCGKGVAIDPKGSEIGHCGVRA